MSRDPIIDEGGFANFKVTRAPFAAERQNRYAARHGREGRLRLDMAEVSRFLGIVIGMFFREHPPPHYHAVYNEGLRLPRRALRHLLEWHEAYQVELLENWRLTQEERSQKIPPLE